MHDVYRLIHVINAILMAWPFYALTVVNQRVKLGSPLGDRADVLMENIIKNRTIPCYVFQATALLSGFGLILTSGWGLNYIFSNPTVGIKFWLLLVIAGVLSYVHFGLQPKIDSLFAEGGNPIPKERVAKIGSLRVRRKQMASICLFVVLVNTMLGINVRAGFSTGLLTLLTILIAVFTWRAYKTGTPYGWI